MFVETGNSSQPAHP